MKKKKVWITWLKIIGVVALLFFLAKKNLISPQETIRALQNWHLTGAAFAALFFATLVGSFRWHVLLKAQNIHIPWIRTFEFAMIGNFFNIALPGAITGDVVKAFQISYEVEGKRAYALSSILFDRVTGVSSLIMVSVTSVLLSYRSDWGHTVIPKLSMIVLVCGLCVVVFYSYLFLLKENHDLVLIFLRTIEKRRSSFGSLLRIYEGIRTYHSKRMVVVLSLLMSFLIHSLVVFAFFEFTYAMEVTSIGFGPLMIVVPLGILVTAVPILPAGVGTGNVAFLALYKLLGSMRGADIFNLFLVYNILLGILGAAIYVLYLRRTSLKTADILQA